MLLKKTNMQTREISIEKKQGILNLIDEEKLLTCHCAIIGHVHYNNLKCKPNTGVLTTRHWNTLAIRFIRSYVVGPTNNADLDHYLVPKVNERLESTYLLYSRYCGSLEGMSTLPLFYPHQISL